MDITSEELSHLEIVSTLARIHLQSTKFARDAAETNPLIAIAGGGGVNLFNSQGNAWTADYLKITGELDVDLRSNIAAEARAKIVYERLINFCDDVGTKDALQFLKTREITHMKASRLRSKASPGRASRSAGFRPRPDSSISSSTIPLGTAITVRSTRAGHGTKASPASDLLECGPSPRQYQGARLTSPVFI
jgi:Mn-containing catalase